MTKHFNEYSKIGLALFVALAAPAIFVILAQTYDYIDDIIFTTRKELIRERNALVNSFEKMPKTIAGEALTEGDQDFRMAQRINAINLELRYRSLIHIFYLSIIFVFFLWLIAYLIKNTSVMAGMILGSLLILAYGIDRYDESTFTVGFRFFSMSFLFSLALIPLSLFCSLFLLKRPFFALYARMVASFFCAIILFFIIVTAQDMQVIINNPIAWAGLLLLPYFIKYPIISVGVIYAVAVKFIVMLHGNSLFTTRLEENAVIALAILLCALVYCYALDGVQSYQRKLKESH
jgi:hypothetical protein